MTKRDQKGIVAKVKRTIKDQNLLTEDATEVCVAVSGGSDSIGLLHVLKKISTELNFKLSACHYNHKIRPESDREEEFVKNICQSLRVELKTGHHRGETIKSEEQARRARYSFFKKILKDREEARVALAHNMDDAAETFLMRVIRGAGTRGLSSIPYFRKNFIRPLLDVKRSEILSYLSDESIKYVVDSSNYNTDYTRNFIRHKLLPQIEKLNPNAIETVKNVSEAVAADYQYIQREAEKSFQRVAKKEEGGIVLVLKDFNHLDIALRYHVLRLGLRALKITKDITKKHLDSMVLLAAKSEGRKELTLPHYLRVKVKDGKIYLMRQDNA